MRLDLQLDELFERPIDAVWRAVTDPRMLARWLMDNDFEPRLGHEFTLRDPPTATWRGWIACRVLEIDPPRRMVWSWDGGMEGEVTTRVVFELHPEGSGTRLVLRHEGEATSERLASLGAGWTRKLAILRHVLGSHYARRVAFGAPRERVFDALATLSGLRGWWTPIVSGSAATGGVLRFAFDGLDEHIVMRVDGAKRPSSVHWSCVVHTRLHDWKDTKVTFDLAARGPEGCELSFQHVGLTPQLDCYADCERGWDHFLASLIACVERGKGTPFGA
jgi:uncharacterized protein YndB with AHSA1/START domain